MTPSGQLTRHAVESAVRYCDSWLAYQQTYQRIPGVQAAVLFDGDVALSTAHGLADVERGVPLTTDHLFRVASHSKTFTATAIMQLVEAGTLTLDDSVGKWLPWSQSPVSDVTLREMLAHSTGIFRDGLDSDFWQLMRPFPNEGELRGIALSGAGVLPPNERFKYSNITFSLLGLVIREASGQAYNDFVTANIVERLGLANTGPELDTSRAGEYAVGYSALTYAATRQPIDHVDTAAMSSATGFYSTAEDLCRYFSAHFWGDDRLITDASKRLLQHDGWDVDHTPDSRYGLGFSVTKAGERRLVGHGGGYPGHITRSLSDPDDRLAVSVLTNAIDGPALALANTVVKLIDLAAARSQPSDARHLRFCGRFANLWGVYDVAALGGRLLLLNPSLPDPTEGYAVLTVEDESTLRVASGPGYGGVGEPLRYVFADDGSVVSVRGPSALTMWPIDSYRPRLSLP